MSLLLKIVVSGCIVGGVNLIAAVNPRMAGWLAALPLVSILSIAWLAGGGAPPEDLVAFVTRVLYRLVPTAAFLAAVTADRRVGVRRTRVRRVSLGSGDVCRAADGPTGRVMAKWLARE
jgi:hypothetical protein